MLMMATSLLVEDGVGDLLFFFCCLFCASMYCLGLHPP